MKKSFSTMGMSATIILVDTNVQEKDIDEVFAYFRYLDGIFSTYIPTSEISKINRGELSVKKASREVKEVLRLCDEAQRQTNGYFDIHRNGKIDPSGMVKGYAIHKGAKKLGEKGYKNFSVEIAGDVEVKGLNENKKKWRVGIENPFVRGEIVKIVGVSNKGIATSGNYKQEQHLYNPVDQRLTDEIASMTVIARDAQYADMLATATFVMGEKGIEFLENLPGVEGYMITKDKTAIYTSGFERFVLQ